MQEIFIEFLSLHWKLCFLSKVFQTFKAFCSFDVTFGSIRNKYRSFATVCYSLVATSTELNQFKTTCLTHTHTAVTLAMRPRTARLIISPSSFSLSFLPLRTAKLINYCISTYELNRKCTYTPVFHLLCLWILYVILIKN